MRIDKRNLVVSAFLIMSSLLLSGCPGDTKPKHYTFEDLRGGMRNEQFYFANANKPALAKVDLGFFPIGVASLRSRMAVVPRVYYNPGKYRAKKVKVYSRWNDRNHISFDWNKFKNQGGRRGDLVFLRATGKWPSVIKAFSNWTHVAFVEDFFYKEVFESLPGTGVDINWAPATWTNLTYYTTKRIADLSYNQVRKALDWAKNTYRGLPYFPKVKISAGLSAFLYRWSNKDDMASMYCSKLVYNTLKKAPYSDVNFDTNNTCTFNDKMQDKSPGAPIFGWVGISPDDIYYSDSLGADFCYSNNVNYI